MIGIKALRRIKAAGPARRQLGLVLEQADEAPVHAQWYDIVKAGAKVGDMTNGVWSRRLKRNIGFALIAAECAPGDAVEVCLDGRRTAASLTELPFF